MSRLVAAVLIGIVFGVGMSVSGMTDPQRVLAFFDVAGQWDPTLAFVMGGAIVPMSIAWRIRARMQKSVLGETLPGPASTAIDGRLLGGSAIFGMGWGIVGLCPGAIVPVLGAGSWPVFAYLAAMLAGMLLARAWLAGRNPNALSAGG